MSRSDLPIPTLRTSGGMMATLDQVIARPTEKAVTDKSRGYPYHFFPVGMVHVHFLLSKSEYDFLNYRQGALRELIGPATKYTLHFQAPRRLLVVNYDMTGSLPFDTKDHHEIASRTLARVQSALNGPR